MVDLNMSQRDSLQGSLDSWKERSHIPVVLWPTVRLSLFQLTITVSSYKRMHTHIPQVSSSSSPYRLMNTAKRDQISLLGVNIHSLIIIHTGPSPFRTNCSEWLSTKLWIIFMKDEWLTVSSLLASQGHAYHQAFPKGKQGKTVQ